MSVSGIDQLIRLLDDEILSIETIRDITNKAMLELTTSEHYLEGKDRRKNAIAIKEANHRLNALFNEMIILRNNKP